MDVLKRVLQLLYFVGVMMAVFGGLSILMGPGSLIGVAIWTLALIAPYKVYQYRKQKRTEPTASNATNDAG